jgi:hypothetical protein
MSENEMSTIIAGEPFPEVQDALATKREEIGDEEFLKGLGVLHSQKKKEHSSSEQKVLDRYGEDFFQEQRERFPGLTDQEIAREIAEEIAASSF